MKMETKLKQLRDKMSKIKRKSREAKSESRRLELAKECSEILADVMLEIKKFF